MWVIIVTVDSGEEILRYHKVRKAVAQREVRRLNRLKGVRAELQEIPALKAIRKAR